MRIIISNKILNYLLIEPQGIEIRKQARDEINRLLLIEPQGIEIYQTAANATTARRF